MKFKKFFLPEQGIRLVIASRSIFTDFSYFQLFKSALSQSYSSELGTWHQLKEEKDHFRT